jgi:phosphate/sulfate permease
MTTVQILSLLVMPVAGLVIAAFALLWVRTWDKHEPKQASSATRIPPRPGGFEPDLWIEPVARSSGEKAGENAGQSGSPAGVARVARRVG